MQSVTIATPQGPIVPESIDEITRIIRCTLLSNPYCEVLIKRHDGIVTIAKTIKERLKLT